MPSPWCARTKFPKKPDGRLRMVHAFIPINKATIKVNYPMQRIEPIRNRLSQSRFGMFFSADAANGYYAVPMFKPHRYKTGFSCMLGLFAYDRMGQGLSGAYATYAKLKDIMAGQIPGPDSEKPLKDCDPDSTFAHFVDDDHGASLDFDTMFDFLHYHYFPRVDFAQLTLSPKKSNFFALAIKMLGYDLSLDGMRPSLDKVKAIRDFPVPTDEVELQRFLYKLPWLSTMIPGRADLAAALKTALIVKLVEVKGKPRKVRRVVGFSWTDEAEQAFRLVKKAVCSNVLSGGDLGKQYHLATDASRTGLGGVLFQLKNKPAGSNAWPIQPEDLDIVMFLSYKLNDVEKNYHMTEKEALAGLRCMEETKWLFQGNPHKLKWYTDHQALIHVLNSDDAHGRLARWQYRFAEFDLDVVHIPGKENCLADGLSRVNGPDSRPLPEYDPPLPVFMAETFETEAKDLTEESADTMHPGFQKFIGSEWYADILAWKLNGTLPEGRTSRDESRMIKRRAVKFVVVRTNPPSLGYFERDGRLATCVVESEVEGVLNLLHEQQGHFSQELILKKALGRFYWPTRGRDIARHCRTCATCQYFGSLKPRAGLLLMLELQPFDMVGMDFLGPFTLESDDTGDKYIWVFVDYFSRYIWTDTCVNPNSEWVKFKLAGIFKTFGAPRAVYSDNGSPFKLWVSDYLRRLGVKQLFSSPGHPQSVGLAERSVQLVKRGLVKAVAEEPRFATNWAGLLPAITHDINTRCMRLKGFTPAELLLGYTLRFVSNEGEVDHDIKVQVLEMAVTNDLALLEAMNVGQRLARLDELREAYTEARKASNKQRSLEEDGTPRSGDLVLLRRYNLDHQMGKKLELRWTGPYIVQGKEDGKQHVWLHDISIGKVIGYHHLDNMKLFVRKASTDFQSLVRASKWTGLHRLDEALEGSRRWRDEEREVSDEEAEY